MLRTLALALVLLNPACKTPSVEKPGESRPAPIAKPGEVVATVQLPSGNSLGSLAQAIDNVQPGASAAVSAQLPLLLQQNIGIDLAGADLAGPVSLLVLNPEKYSAPVALLVVAKDRTGLEASAKQAGHALVSRDGLALIGAPEVVESARAFAFATLATPSKELIGTVYPAPLLEAYSSKVDEFYEGMAESMVRIGNSGIAFKAMVQIYREGVAAMGEQTERIEISAGVDGANSELYLRMFPRQGSTLAAFIAAQVPAEHNLLGKLPAPSTRPIVFSGELRAGAARDALMEFSTRAMATFYGHESSEELAKLMRLWADAFDGSMAMTLQMDVGGGSGVPPSVPKMQANFLMGTSDPNATRRSWRSMFKLVAKTSQAGTLSMLGMKFLVDFKENARRVDGVEVDYYRSAIDLDELPAERKRAMAAMAPSMEQTMYFAVFDKVAAMASSLEDRPGGIEHMIATARGKQSGFVPTGGIAKAIATSKKRNESFVFAMDLSAFMPNGEGVQAPPFQFMAWGFGNHAGALTLRIAIGK